MYAHDELKSLHGFLKATGEGNLKKMLVNGPMTEAHLRLLLKVARPISEDEFIVHVEANSLPKVKLNPAETAIKETFWTVCCDACAKMGLLTKKATKAA